MDNENRTDLRPEAELNEEGNITVHKNKTVDFIAKIICLLLAFFVWYYAASVDTAVYEKEVLSLPVVIENKTDLTTFAGDTLTVDITLSGKKNDINKVSSSSVRAYVIVTGVTEAGQYTFDIRYDGLPSGVTVKKSSASWIQIYVGTKKAEDIPLTSDDVVVKTDKDGYEFSAVPSVSTVRVSGPTSTVNKIKSARLVVDASGKDLSENFTHIGSIVLLDENGDEINSRYLEISPSVVSADVKVIAEREVPVSVKFKHGFVTEDNCDIAFNTAAVKVKGEVSLLKDASIEFVIDEKTLKDGVPVLFPITSGAGLQYSTETVAVTVNFKNTAEKTLTVTPVSVNGGVLDDMILSPIAVTVRGDKTLIASLTESDIIATADVSGADIGSSVEVSFEFSGEFDGKVYEIYEANSPYTVGVTVGP